MTLQSFGPGLPFTKSSRGWRGVEVAPGTGPGETVLRAARVGDLCEAASGLRPARTREGLSERVPGEIIADNLSKAGWSWGCVSAVTREGRLIWVADAHHDDGKRFVAHVDERLSAFMELESAIRARSELS